MTARVLVAVSTSLLLVVAACSSDDVVVDEAREASLQSDGGPETIEAPDFELELEPGQDPDEVLTQPGPTPPPAPGDALAVLCPSVEALVAGLGTDADVAVVQAAVPERWRSLVDDIADPVGRGDDPAVADLDAWFYDSCSVPLFSGTDQIGTGCGDRSCRADRVEIELGGICFDDGGVGPDGGRGFRLLSCVSGLPI